MRSPRPSLSQAVVPPRYVELVNAACNFEPHESFFSLFSDPRSTRLSRIHLREDLVQDQDLEAIRKQVRPSPANGESGAGCHLLDKSPRPVRRPSPLCRPLRTSTWSPGPGLGQGLGRG